MKRLKYRVWFGGYKFPVRLSLILASFISVMLISELRSLFTELSAGAELLFVLMIAVISILLPMLLFYLWFHMLSDDDRRQIADAEPAHWRGITEAEILSVVRRNSDSAGVIAAAIFAGLTGIIVFAVCLKAGLSGKALLIAAACTVAAVTAAILAGRYMIRYWQNIDDTADAADLPVARCFSRASYSRYGRKRERHFAVCYLPDGKYVLRIDREQTDTLTVIRWKRQYCILTPSAYKEDHA